jgi:phosphatidylglycerol---prolipoprotein diacylglyceryl transferase
MYPTVSEFLKSLGIDIALPIQTFGFFVAIAFIVAAIAIGRELKRKQAEGILKPTEKIVETGKAAGIIDYIQAGIIGFLVGFKILFMVLNYSEFVDDPQNTLLSLKGNWIGGILAAAVFIYLRFRESETQKKQGPGKLKVTMNAEDHVGNIILMGVVGGLVGAKIFHNLENPAEFMADPVGSLLSFSGLTFYGGLIVAATLIIRYGKKNGLPALHLTDAAAPALITKAFQSQDALADGATNYLNRSTQPHFTKPSWQ